jgi:hypothetical protein
LNRTVSENKLLRWGVLGRVVLFLLGCAFVLAATAPLTHKLPELWPNLVLGAVASLGAFALTVLFVRWEGLRLEDVGAAPARWSLPRFAFGFLVGLVLVALSASISAATGHMRWARTPGVGFSDATITFFTYIALSAATIGTVLWPLGRADYRSSCFRRGTHGRGLALPCRGINLSNVFPATNSMAMKSIPLAVSMS